MRSVLHGIFRTLNHLLQAPQKVLIICLGVVAFSLIVDGSLLRWWSLNRDLKVMQSNIQILETQNAKLKLQLQKAKDPAFLEREARDRFDLVSAGDLVFVFSEEDNP